jgi:hypothetical protein
MNLVGTVHAKPLLRALLLITSVIAELDFHRHHVVRKKPPEPPSSRGNHQTKNPPELPSKKHPRPRRPSSPCRPPRAPAPPNPCVARPRHLELPCHPRRSLSDLEDDRRRLVTLPGTPRGLDILKLLHHRHPRRSLPDLEDYHPTQHAARPPRRTARP